MSKSSKSKSSNSKSSKSSKSKSSKSPQRQSLQLQGRVLELIGKSGKPPKSIQLATVDGTKRLKLAKSIRKLVAKDVEPGQWVSVSGIAKRAKATKPWNYKVDAIAPAAPVAASSDAPQPAAAPVAALSQTSPPKSHQPPQSTKPTTILVCRKSKCCKRGAIAVMAKLEQEVGDRGLTQQIKLKATGCMSRCKKGPNVVVMPGKTKLTQVKAKDIPDLVNQIAADYADSAPPTTVSSP